MSTAARDVASRQQVEKGLRLPQIGGVKSLGEAAVDRGEKIMRFGAAALQSQKLGQANGGTQLEPTRALFARNVQCSAKASLDFGPVWRRQASQQLAPEPMELSVSPSLA